MNISRYFIRLVGDGVRSKCQIKPAMDEAPASAVKRVNSNDHDSYHIILYISIDFV